MDRRPQGEPTVVTAVLGATAFLALLAGALGAAALVQSGMAMVNGSERSATILAGAAAAGGGVMAWALLRAAGLALGYLWTIQDRASRL